MNQLLYNIAGGTVHKIRREYKRTIIYFAVSEINKIGFIAIFLLKARVSYLTISKWKNLSLPLKDETDQFVTCLVYQSVFLSKLHFTLEQ